MPERPDLAALRARYTPEPVLPCPVCGGELELRAAGGGRPDVWACSRYQDPMPYLSSHLHYSASRTESRPGDPAVLALADYAEGLEREVKLLAHGILKVGRTRGRRLLNELGLNPEVKPDGRRKAYLQQKKADLDAIDAAERELEKTAISALARTAPKEPNDA